MINRPSIESLYTTILLRELESRKLSNPSYSLRAFARDLGISKSLLSDVLSKKRCVGSRAKSKILSKLSFSNDELKALSQAELEKFQAFSEDQFRVIADWYYFAILNLAQIPETPYNASIISRRLGISSALCAKALSRLLKLQLIKNNDGIIVRTSKSIFIGENIPSQALKIHHKQNLDRAKESIDTTSLEFREITTVTMAVNLEKMNQVKKEIRKFRTKVMDIMESGKPTEVYTFSMQLFPQSNRGL